jgi:hypothetical protein
MGTAKHMMEQGYNSDIGSYICPDCIQEDGIKAFIIENSTTSDSTCSYCNDTKIKTCNMGLVVGYIHDCIIKEWSDPAEELPYESAEGGYQGNVLDTHDLLWQVGVSVDDESILDDIAESIHQSHWTKNNYFSLAPDQTLSYGWKSFCQIVMSKSRYFFLSASNKSYDRKQHDEMNPIEILDSVASIIKNLTMLKEIPTSEEIKRVRIVDEYREATTASDLGSPPLDFCKMANRMSPAGIPMFYGAFDLETSIKETYEPEPNLTKKAVAGNFYPCRTLNVIDLSQKFKIPTIFDQDQSFRFEKRFLYDFIKDFTKPIERADRAHIDYVPTQIVTEYFRHILSKDTSLKIDGVIYPSSKNQNHKAIVIFADNDQCVEKGTKSRYTEELLFLNNFEEIDLTPFNTI